MRGVGELPSNSAASFPEQTTSANGAPAKNLAAEPSNAPSALQLELASLNQVRSLLQRGQGADALRALEQYQVRFPHGSLAAEAMLLRVQAFALAGRRDEAARAAERMIERYPRSPHKARLQELGLLPAH
jgi:TolA-binding protein